MTVVAALTYQQTYNRIRVGVAATVARLWDAHGGLDDAAQRSFAGLASSTVIGGQAATARLVASYIAMQGGTTNPATFTTEELRTLRGVDLLDVYRRAVVSSRTAIARGDSFAAAMAAGRVRAKEMASTDIVMAQRHATVRTLDQMPHAVGYRRVLTGSSCQLCATASTQRYHKTQLMPIHTHCDCSVAPIFANRDPGQVINRRLLAQLKDADGPVAVHMHGELGPVLTPRGQHFTGPSDI